MRVSAGPTQAVPPSHGFDGCIRPEEFICIACFLFGLALYRSKQQRVLLSFFRVNAFLPVCGDWDS